MPDAKQLLKKYWGHDEFRMPQSEIIQSVLDGRDNFVLMPTGGGKSICFQIPPLMHDGLCLVISPLVALMKDQVANLQAKGIKAIALTGGIPQHEISDLLDNCQFGNYKFLYLSPERLQIDWILERIKNLPINLVAIDEAHCVSQWGHDFRPSYLKIALLKPHFPKVPFLALTASATARVQQDIIDHLSLENPVIFKKSFARQNLAYMVLKAEDKLFRAEQILKKHPQPSIIYVRNRKSCIDVSQQLNALGIPATYYHGGLHAKEKDQNMQLWMQEKARVIVATNAFGMGIDKPNVKTVIHIQLPENLENYYQEAGRGGRNGDDAFAVLLVGASDIDTVKSQFLGVLPDKEFLTTIYIKLCNYFQIAYSEGIGETFSFNLNQFCLQYKFNVMKAYNALQFLDQQGIITLSQEFSEKITAQFIIPSKEVLRYMSLNPADEAILLAMLRSYPGIHEIATPLNLPLLVKKSGREQNEILELLEKLKKRNIIEYQARKNDATLLFNEVREDARTINRVSKYLENQNQLKTSQLADVIDYVSDQSTCKSVKILNYFGEDTKESCGICSVCIKGKPSNAVSLRERILEHLTNKNLSSRDLENLTNEPSDAIIFALRQLLEQNAIRLRPDNSYTKRK